MANRMTKKELRAPDAFQRVGGEAQSWVQAHQGTLALIVTALVLGMGGVALAGYVQDRGEEKAGQELALAMRTIDRPVGNQPTDVREDASNPPFKTQDEKDEAVVKALSEFRAAHPRTRAAATSALQLALAELRLKKFDDSLVGFDEYLKAKHDQADNLRALALEGRGYALEGKGELDQAIAAYQDLAVANTGTFMEGMGQYHRARILVEQKKLPEAAVAFQEVQTKFPQSAASRLAAERLNLLAAMGVKPPAPAPLMTFGKDAG